MNNSLQIASKILFDLVSGFEPRLKPLANWYQTTISTIDKWYLSEGNQGIKRAKDCLSQGWLSILGEATTQQSFVKSVDGIPEIVKPLVDRVKSCKLDSRLLSGTLSLIRVTDLWMGRPEDKTILTSLRVINDTKLPLEAQDVIEEFSSFLQGFLEAYPNHPLVSAYCRAIPLDDSSTVYYRESAGPNGPLTANAHKDVVTLMRSTCSNGESLLDAVNKLQQNICNASDFSFHPDTKFVEEVKGYIEGNEEQSFDCSDTPGKLTVIPEKSGKVRIVASPDYYSQYSLRPVHRWLERCLKSLPADCTFDQGSAIPKIVKWHSEGRYIASFDQSSCTDLFPLAVQTEVLKQRFGNPLVESVRTVMVDRDWSLKLPQSQKVKKVRWSVGQPMGLLASWPLMALTHHLLVQYCYWISSGRKFSKKGPFNDYVICGDDIVIASRNVSNSYLSVIKKLGMKVNLSKSHISGKGTGITPVSEFAKVTVWNGQPIIPVKPNMVLSSVKDWRYAVPLFIDLANSPCFSIKLKKFKEIVSHYYRKGSKYLIPLLTIPQEFGGVGYKDSKSFVSRFDHLETREIHPWLYFLARRIHSGLKTEQKLLSVSFDSIPSKLIRHHPVVEYCNMESANVPLSLLYEEVPTTEEICRRILLEGIRAYDRFLVPIDRTEVPPFRAEDSKLLEIRSSWRDALEKRHYFSKDSYEEIKSLLKSLASPKIKHESFSDLMRVPLANDELYNHRLSRYQCDICERVLLARRSNEGLTLS